MIFIFVKILIFASQTKLAASYNTQKKKDKTCLKRANRRAIPTPWTPKATKRYAMCLLFLPRRRVFFIFFLSLSVSLYALSSEEISPLLRVNSSNSINSIFNFNNVNTINEDNKLKFIGDIQIVFKDIQKFYNHFQIEKNNRKNINQINSNFIFNFDDRSFEFNELKVSGVDNVISDQDLNQFNSEKQNILNEILFKNKVRDFFNIISSE